MNEIIELNENEIKNKIFTIRNQKVMLDFHLAEIYGYTTKAFNQQVQRNIEKFDDDFRFQLTISEYNVLRSQIVTSKINSKNRGGRRYIPYVFTEQGIYMLMTILKGEKATKQSKMLIRLFKGMKDYIIETSNYVTYSDFTRESMIINENISGIKKEMVTKNELNNVINELTDKKIPKEYLILNGKRIEGNLAYKEIYSKANKTIYIIDNYINLKTLVLLKDIDKEVKVIIFSDNLNKGLHELEYRDFINEYDLDIELKVTNGIFHDRYIIIDYQTSNEIIYTCGPSSKDVGNRIGTISKTRDNFIYHELIENLLKNENLLLT